MFTGIISHLGKVRKVENSIFTFSTPKSFYKKINKGLSVAINGVCMTVMDKPSSDCFAVEAMPESLRKTMFNKLKINGSVNLELPVTSSTLLSGHLVQGHVDGIGKIEEIEREGKSRILKISIPKSLSKYIVEKGSIAVNGISLTIIEARSSYFTVGIIPYTFSHTMLSKVSVGDLVNIEVDVLAKYLEKLISKRYE